MTGNMGFNAQEIPDWHGGKQLTINNKPNHSVTFQNEKQETIGALDFNGPELVFTGDASQSAQVFIRYLSTVFRDRLSDERNLLIEAIEQISFASDEQRLTAKIIVQFLKSVPPNR